MWCEVDAKLACMPGRPAGCLGSRAIGLRCLPVHDGKLEIRNNQ